MHSLLHDPRFADCRRLFLRDYAVWINIGVHEAMFPLVMVLWSDSDLGLLTDRIVVAGSDDPLLYRAISQVANALQSRALISYTATGSQLGLSLLATLTAHDFGYVTTTGLIERTGATLDATRIGRAPHALRRPERRAARRSGGGVPGRHRGSQCDRRRSGWADRR